MIRYANRADFDMLKTYDKHICESELRNVINRVCSASQNLLKTEHFKAR